MRFSLRPTFNIYLFCVWADVGKMTHLFKGQRVYKYISALILQVGILISPFSLLPCYFHCSYHGQAEPCNSLLLITILWNCFVDNILLGSLETFLTSYAKNKSTGFNFFFILSLYICKCPCTIIRSQIYFIFIKTQPATVP